MFRHMSLNSPDHPILTLGEQLRLDLPRKAGELF